MPFVITNHPTFFFSPKTPFDPPYLGVKDLDFYRNNAIMIIFLFVVYIAIVSKFGLHWLASNNPRSVWTPHTPIVY